MCLCIAYLKICSYFARISLYLRSLAWESLKLPALQYLTAQTLEREAELMIHEGCCTPSRWQIFRRGLTECLKCITVKDLHWPAHSPALTTVKLRLIQVTKYHWTESVSWMGCSKDRYTHFHLPPAARCLHRPRSESAAHRRPRPPSRWIKDTARGPQF